MNRRILLLGLLALLTLSSIAFSVVPSYSPVDNAANIDQVGQNTATIYQDGVDNWGYVNQQGTNYNDGADLFGGYIRQLGNNGIARIEMKTDALGDVDFSRAEISQDGTGNEAWQYLGLSDHYGGAVANGLEIVESGDDNFAFQKTTAGVFGPSGIRDMYASLIGNDNFSYQHSIGGDVSSMKVDITGNNNDYDPGGATGITTPDGDSVTFPLNLAFNGKPSVVSPAPSTLTPPFPGYMQYQNGNGSSASITITGHNNHVAQYQEYVSSSGLNDAVIEIVNGDDNHVFQAQLGENNVVEANIDGSGNNVQQSQEGSNNSAIANITGNDHTVAQQQTGNNFSSVITISGGNGGFATVIQM